MYMMQMSYIETRKLKAMALTQLTDASTKENVTEERFFN